MNEHHHSYIIMAWEYTEPSVFHEGNNKTTQITGKKWAVRVLCTSCLHQENL